MDRCRTELAIGARTAPAFGAIDATVAKLVRVMLRAYQLLISPLLGGNCRFEPSCSRFADEAIAAHGPWRGSVLAARRLLRCHPWGGPGGYDPVP